MKKNFSKIKKFIVCFVAMVICFTSSLALFLINVINKEDFSEKFILEKNTLIENLSESEKFSENEIISENKSTISVELHSDFDSQFVREEYLKTHSVDTTQDLSSAVSYLRNKSSEHYYNLRSEFAKKTNIDVDLEISSPFVEFQVDRKINDIKDLDAKLLNILKDDLTEKFYVRDVINDITIDEVYQYDTEEQNSNFESSTYASTSYSFDKALSIVNAKNVMNTYTGKGVIVGIYEANDRDGTVGLVDSTNAAFKNRDIALYNPTNSNGRTKHATGVASIAVGNNGIAREAKILSSAINSNKDSELTMTNAQWMINNNVNVINMSFGSPTGSGYSSTIAMFDKFSKDNYVTMVAASGNSGDDYSSTAGRVGSPAIGFNIIAVGGSNYNGTSRVSFSDYTEPWSVAKPNLIAPAEVYIPDISTQLGATNYSRGTSFAAPIVTGAIALAIEKRPVLALYPERIHALVTASANEPFSGYNSFYAGFENQVGAGMLNVERFLDSVNNTIDFSYSASAESGKELQMIKGNLSANQTIKVSTFWYALLDGTSYNFSDVDLHLFFNNVEVASSRSANNNLELLRYTANNSGEFIIVIKLYTKKGNDLDIGAVAYSIL